MYSISLQCLNALNLISMKYEITLVQYKIKRNMQNVFKLKYDVDLQTIFQHISISATSVYLINDASRFILK